MKKRNTLMSIALAGALVLGVTPAAHAQWGQTGDTYCSSSTGCYISKGKAVHTTVGPKLTAKEQNLQLQCNLRLAGTAFAGAGGIMGKNWLAVLGAAFNGGAALAGPCKQLWDSTTRFRK